MGKSRYSSEEERLQDFKRRYEAEKQAERESGREGDVYNQSLEKLKRLKKKKRLIRKAKLYGIYAGLLLAAVLVLVLLIMLIKLIAGSFNTEDGIVSGEETNSEVSENITEIPTPKPENLTPTPTPIPKVTPAIDTTASYRGHVVVDAGHGGIDGGTVIDGVCEKDIDLEIALLLRDRLEEYGYTVTMTRTEDVFVGLSNRPKLANELGDVQALLSIHCNSIENHPDVNGVETWCYNRPGSSELASLVAEQVAESTGARNRGVGYKTNLVVTSKAKMPSIIVECGYLSGDKEHELLQDGYYQQLIVNGILVGLDMYLKEAASP